ncbi:MAG TPA: 3-oxoacyl-[acyl-carrier-protein] reductase [Anaerolineae bacterium]|nr:3-oxoacyl-[acyl-carrier-protein] reductase [Anaerolineae bacterium]
MSGKVALVTGSSRGIGRAIALRLAADGCQVVVNYRAGADAAAEVVGSIEAAGGTAIAVQADVTDAAAVESLIGQTLERFGRLDVLVNNAGVTRDGLLMRMKDEDWDMVIATNLRSVFLASRAVLRPMMRQRGGRIVSITSISGLSGNAGQCNYAAAKAGIVGFTRSLAKEAGARGITVNAVAPGYVPTDLTSDLPQTLLDEAVKATPLGRLGTAEDIAAAVSFLASDDAAFITGQVLRVDGGMVF